MEKSRDVMTDLRSNTEIDASRVIPLRAQILIRVEPVENRMANGLIIAGSKEFPDQRKGTVLCRIISTGPYVDADLKPGMILAILPSSGRWVGDGDNGDEQTPFRMIEEDEALAVVGRV